MKTLGTARDFSRKAYCIERGKPRKSRQKGVDVRAQPTSVGQKTVIAKSGMNSGGGRGHSFG